MVEGFIPDYLHGGQRQLSWHCGQLVRSFWLGVVAKDDSEEIAVGAFRCARCGFLELYADQRFAPKRA